MEQQGDAGSSRCSRPARGFPRTHYFAQARVVFAVARSRCSELFSLPGSITLWELPAEIEDQFEEQWQSWLDQSDQWAPLFEQLAELQSHDLLGVLSDLGLLCADQFQSVARLRRSVDGHGVPLPATPQPTDAILTLLAAGFALGQPGSPAIPHARLESLP